jgi:hypothetical protein
VEVYSKNAQLIPIFHGNISVKPLDKKGDYFLFHGDLTTADNKRALNETIDLFKDLPQYRLIVASDRASEDIKREYQPLKISASLLFRLQKIFIFFWKRLMPTFCFHIRIPEPK